ncbi:MAG: putative Ig domain-containing protein, partial [Bacteroidetes bacterium]|nr:putative Ig domain-containing protein [Bacteroidota bacterium]
SAPSGVNDWVTFTFDVTDAGAYKVFARIQSTSGSDDSYWVRANGGTWQEWNKINSGSYGAFFQWSQVGNWTSGCCATPVTFNLVQGSNTIDFSWREPNTNLDKIFVTLTGSVPGGSGGPASNCGQGTPIIVNPVANQTNNEGDNANVTVMASGGDGNLTFAAVNLPTGVTIDPTNGLIGGTIDPGASVYSPYNVTITVDDSDTTSSDEVVINFTWTVYDPNAPIVIVVNSFSNQQDTEGDAINLQVNASGGNGALQYSATGLPVGLSINLNSGLISGTIAAGAANNSPYAVSVEVDDSDTTSSDKETINFSWVVDTPGTDITDVWLEAECATVGSQWTEQTNAGASEGKYLAPPNTTNNNWAPPTPDDWVTFTFDVTQPGAYKVFARIQATSGSSDSYWVRANGGTWQEWNKINSGSYSSAFQWSQVGNWTGGCCPTPVTFNLVAGTNSVDFAWRELNTNLDKIFVTLNGSVPGGLGDPAGNCGLLQIPIQLAAISNQSDSEGDLINLQVSASGGDGPLSYQATGLPSGLSINTTSGLMSGTLANGASTTSPYNITITVDDNDTTNSDAKTTSFSWTVHDPNAPIPIVISSISNQQNDEGDNVSFQVNASGGNGSLTYQASGLPTGLSINPNTGLISGIIANGAEANSPFAVAITVNDSDSDLSDIEVENFLWEVFIPGASVTDFWLEAECATVGNLWTEVNDNSASGGKYLNPPNSSSTGSAPSGVNDWVTFTFDVTDAGAYKV